MNRPTFLLLSFLLFGLSGTAALAQDRQCPADESQAWDQALKKATEELTSVRGPYAQLGATFNPLSLKHLRDFVAPVAGSAELRKHYWSRLTKIVSGGNGDADGSLMRKTLQHLPVEEWYFVAYFDMQRQLIIDALGGSGGPWSNAWENIRRGWSGDVVRFFSRQDLEEVRTRCLERSGWTGA